ncbi:MAG: Rne/Rng family ribonuclease [Robiginitomaculum sp.]|nr:Rne/Rng family ribonuclease [Robiginitomaculum sp.]
MTKRMLIDAAHPEQTRVAIVDESRVEEFDFESSNKKQLRGNIYLAKVTRVEASLQAAFVDYGGNRHGFLAFSEIHPDYYQIPVEDRQKLLEAEAEAAEEIAEEIETEIASDGDGGDDDTEVVEQDADSAEEAQIAIEASKKRERRKRNNYRRYKIQEVIKHGQIMLVQVVKEERGTKGAALTTYMSLAGRYCVLMPNTAKGGGISRKITNVADRKRLKKITSDLEIAKGMGLIIRTAGAKRNKTEIKRDYDYLSRLWGTIREKTLKSSAPNLVHEEGGLVRRAVRDLYDKGVDSIHVEGEEAYNEAKEFMQMLMPSHANRVKHYTEKHPIFLHYKVEDQLESIHSAEVQLKSGGYLVIHQTEALVAIDVNSGRATRERNIEATALKTNLEAAEESCRQMRLRDLAGLIVIDFIDMDENKNNRAVEKRMKDSLKRDRARVQAGRISMFGLFEMSRQRRRASVIEGTSQTCPTCNGLGVVRSIESSALQALQAIESEGMRNRANIIKLIAPPTVALYILNEKRAQLAEIELQAQMRVMIESDLQMIPPQHEIEVVELDKSAKKEKPEQPASRKNRRGRKPKEKTTVEKNETEAVAADTQSETKPDAPKQHGTTEDQNSGQKKRRRGRRGGRSRNKEDNTTEVKTETQPAQQQPIATEQPAEQDQTSDKPKRKVRRRRKSTDVETNVDANTTEAPVATKVAVVEEKATKPTRTRRTRRTKASKEAKADNTSTKPVTNEEVAAPKQAETKPESSKQVKRKVRKRPTATIAQDTQTSKPAKAATKKSSTKPVKTEETPKPETATSKSKPARKVRKRPVKTTSGDDLVEVKTEKLKPVAKKSARRKTTARKTTTAKKVEQETKKPATSTTKTRRRPATKKTEQVAKPDEPSKVAPKAAPIVAVKTEKPAKKIKRSWLSRTFGGDKDEQ